MPKKRGPYKIQRHPVTQPSDPSYRLIPLTQGQNAIVDTEDFEWLSQWNWFAYWDKTIKGFYARRRGTPENGKFKMIAMHAEIIKCPRGKIPDHKNRDTLDNRKENLRIATHAQNAQNSTKKRSNCGYRGVFYDKKWNKWKVYISFKNKKVWVGQFDSAEEAARAFDRMAIKLHGDFAILNFPREQYE